MSESLSKTPSRFYVFLVLTNVCIFLLLLFWIYQYQHGGQVAAELSNPDSFLNRKASFLVFNKYHFEPYVLDFGFSFVSSVFYLGYLVAERKAKPAIANFCIVIYSLLLLVACVFIQAEMGVQHLWSCVVSLSILQNSMLYDFKKGKNENPNSNKLPLSGIQTLIFLLTLTMCLLGEGFMSIGATG